MADVLTFSLLDTMVVVHGAPPDMAARLAACYGQAHAANAESRTPRFCASRMDPSDVSEVGDDQGTSAPAASSGSASAPISQPWWAVAAGHAELLVVKVHTIAGGWVIEVPTRPAAKARDLLGAVRTLNHELMHALMLRHPHLFFVHGGVVAVGGRAVVLPGLSRAGKSTLVLALLCAGARLLSDELMVYDPQARCLLPYARAVKVRDECVPYFPQFASVFVGDGEGRFLPLEALAAAQVAARAELGLVVAPRWDAAGDDVLRPLSAGEGLLHLTRSALNFGSQRERSLDHLAALAGGSACYALTWRDPHAAARAILARLEA